MFSKKTNLGKGLETIPIKSVSERNKFTLGAFNAGEGSIAKAQRLAEKDGKNPQLWGDVEMYLADEARQYIPKVLSYQDEFSLKSPADKNIKQKDPGKGNDRCTEGHWVTIDDRHVFICD